MVSDIGDLIWSFLELASLLNKAARIPWPMGPDPGLKCDSMGRNGKEGVPSVSPTGLKHFEDRECG